MSGGNAAAAYGISCCTKMVTASNIFAGLTLLSAATAADRVRLVCGVAAGA